MSSELEKDVNDEVYEDSFYDNEEELEEEEAGTPKAVVADDDAAPVEEDARIALSFACEDCDYRWDDVIIKNKEDEEDDFEFSATCPMCGSQNVTQI